RSASIVVIIISLLPFAVLTVDPIVRSYKYLGRLFLATRVVVLSCLIAVLYFGIGRFGLTGPITVAVCAVVVERVIAYAMIIRKLGLGLEHLSRLTSIAKTAVVSAIAGLATFFVYSSSGDYLRQIAE